MEKKFIIIGYDTDRQLFRHVSISDTVTRYGINNKLNMTSARIFTSIEKAEGILETLEKFHLWGKDSWSFVTIEDYVELKE